LFATWAPPKRFDAAAGDPRSGDTTSIDSTIETTLKWRIDLQGRTD